MCLENLWKIFLNTLRRMIYIYLILTKQNSVFTFNSSKSSCLYKKYSNTKNRNLNK